MFRVALGLFEDQIDYFSDIYRSVDSGFDFGGGSSSASSILFYEGAAFSSLIMSRGVQPRGFAESMSFLQVPVD